MQNFAELHLKPETLARYGLPDIPYPIPAADLKSALLDNGDLPLAAMLLGLQQRSRDGEAEWQQVEPAMDRLAELLAPDDARDVISAAGDHWWLEVGPVDLGGKLVTIQRGDALIAAITARDDGRLRVAVFRPLDAKSAEYLSGLGQVPHPEHGVCMRENNWEYALDCSAGNGNHYAAERGEAYLSYWEKGLGISWDGSDVPEWRKQLDLVARPASRVVAELGVYYTLSGNEDEEPVADEGAEEEFETPVPPGWRSKRQQKRTVQGRFLGCLLGGAVGDALGAPVEFMKRAEILRRFGPKGITQYAPAYGGLGTITDDTQMAHEARRDLVPTGEVLELGLGPAFSLLGFDGRHEARAAQSRHIGRVPVGARFHEGVHRRVGRVITQDGGQRVDEHRLAVRACAVQEKQRVLLRRPGQRVPDLARDAR